MSRKPPQRRFFVAIDAPESVRTAVAALPKRFPEMPGLSWTPLHQLHLTLRFLGEIDEFTAAAVRGGLAEVEFAPFRLVTAEVGFFPSERHPNIFWLGLNHDDRLPAFKGLVDQVLAARGFPRESRRFTPHITLARVKGPLTDDQTVRLGDAHQFLSGHGFTVDRFLLYASELTPSGAIHTLEETYPAKG